MKMTAEGVFQFREQLYVSRQLKVLLNATKEGKLRFSLPSLVGHCNGDLSELMSKYVSNLMYKLK